MDEDSDMRKVCLHVSEGLSPDKEPVVTQGWLWEDLLLI